jgi:hypothetical protein
MLRVSVVNDSVKRRVKRIRWAHRARHRARRGDAIVAQDVRVCVRTHFKLVRWNELLTNEPAGAKESSPAWSRRRNAG